MLDETIRQSLAAVLVKDEQFAIATGKDADNGRYRGLVVPPDPTASVQVTDSTLLVDIGRAQAQVEADRAAASEPTVAPGPDGGKSVARGVDYVWSGGPAADGGQLDDESELEDVLARFFGSVRISSDRYARDIGNITREIIDRLAGAGAALDITIDIQATKPEGFNEAEVRTISENASALKFDPNSGFEKN